MDPTLRYREYLRSFGIVEAGDRVAELRDLDLETVRFFAYASDNDGLRLKAAVTPGGLVSPGGRASDDWYGFLSRMPDAVAAAERIAWLETDSSTTAHGLPGPPVAVLAPNRPLPPGLDPAQRVLVTAPALLAGSDVSVSLIAWFLTGGARAPTRWTIRARPGADAAIACATAQDLLLAIAGSATAAAADAAGRARRLLATGTDDERWWALQHIGDTGDRAAAADVAALLADAAASPNVRLHAIGTLARLGDPSVVPALGVALRTDGAPEVRRASAQALGRIGGGALQTLAEAVSDQPDVAVCAEIVHALAAQGSAAHDALSWIARSDLDASIRELALGSVEAMGQQER
jgi:hypothetical protein